MKYLTKIHKFNCINEKMLNRIVSNCVCILHEFYYRVEGR